jgi:hypothetical protein
MTKTAPFGGTLFFLMGQYGSRAVIPVEDVRRDYFPHLNAVGFIRRCDNGVIPLRLMRADKSQKSARGVHIQDLANYIDGQRAKAKDPNAQPVRQIGTTCTPRGP